MNLDGWAIFRAIGSNREAFASIEADLQKASLQLCFKALKKAKDEASLKAIAGAVGAEQFGIALEYFSDKDIAGLIKTFDPHNPERAAAKPVWLRQRLKSIASGRELPVAKPTTPAKNVKEKKGRKTQLVAGMTDDNPWPSAMTTVAPRRRSE